MRGKITITIHFPLALPPSMVVTEKGRDGDKKTTLFGGGGGYMERLWVRDLSEIP